MTAAHARAASPDAVATVTVALGESRSYPIHVGRGLLARASDFIGPILSQRRVFIVTDSIVAGLYLERLSANLHGAGIHCDHAIVPAGEGSKDFAQLETLLDTMIAAKCERSTMVIALGGGVIGDLAGFAAAVLLRGVDFIQIPTTLLAQVDSAVGGKTGINTKAGKNLVGAFHQPRLVLADTETLATLPKRQVRAGYAEVAKYGVLGDAEFWAWLEHNGKAAIDGSAAALQHCIVTSCAAKARIVAADERESGVRALLNLGHTFGHALEAEWDFGDELLHGEGVALGLVLASDLSVHLGHSKPEDTARVRAHLAAVGLPVAVPRQGPHGPVTPQALIAHMSQDKKVKDGRVNFVLPRGIGDAFVTRDVPRKALEDTLAAALAP